MKRFAALLAAILFLALSIPAPAEMPLIAKAPAPERIEISPEDRYLYVGDRLQLTASPVPAEADARVIWSSSKSAIAAVGKDGLVRAKKAGTVKIRAMSRANRAIRTVRIFTVAPYAVKIQEGNQYLGEGEVKKLTVKTYPAELNVTWSSMNSSVATVDSNGTLRGVKKGSTTVLATTPSGKSSGVKVMVLNITANEDTPARKTKTSEMQDNLARIDAVYYSAKNLVDSLAGSGVIAASDADRRTAMLVGAFSQYRFPWMTTQVQKYWTRKYGTLKDFYPGYVYYGLPYIQYGSNDSGLNRRFNAAKAIANRFYVSSGKGYYLMNHSKRLNGTYVGSDCSSFVGMSIYGAKSTAYARTSELVRTSRFRTLASYDLLRPGDILVRGNDHCFMFLYFTDAAKTRMMIVEQGGGNETTDVRSTVSCGVVETARYLSKGYAARRLAALGQL